MLAAAKSWTITLFTQIITALRLCLLATVLRIITATQWIAEQ